MQPDIRGDLPIENHDVPQADIAPGGRCSVLLPDELLGAGR